MTIQQSVGDWGENEAVKHLESIGYRIVDRNWHRVGGELDIIAESNGQLVFVEVKARSSSDYGTPEEAVTARKQAYLRRAAWSYLEQTQQLDAMWRINVIAIERTPTGKVGRLDHYSNAVGAGDDSALK
ncbi:MAG: YraN family protein [Anaerolineales bacterium]